MNVRSVGVLIALASLGVVAACNSASTVPAVTASPAPACDVANCAALDGKLLTIALPSLGRIAIDIVLAGTGTVAIADSKKPFGGETPLTTMAVFAARSAVPLFYVKITAINASATLTDIPGFKITFSKNIPAGTLRLAALLHGVWTTVGKPGSLSGDTLTFKAIGIDPPIHLDKDRSYELGVYSGGIVPPIPSPTPSPTTKPSSSPAPTPTPTPGALTVTVACNSKADACGGGTTTSPGSAQFTAKGDSATLTPSETPPSVYTLERDTCNKTDDPSAGGNWATIAPGPGSSAASFTVTAKNGGANGNPASCIAVISDGSGRTVTIDVGVTISNVGVH